MKMSQIKLILVLSVGLNATAKADDINPGPDASIQVYLNGSATSPQGETIQWMKTQDTAYSTFNESAFQITSAPNFAKRTAAQCGQNTNLSLNRFGRVRNQGQMGWCFAYAAADLLQFCSSPQDRLSACQKSKALSQPCSTDEQISAADLDLQFAMATPGLTGLLNSVDILDQVTNGGTAHFAIETLNQVKGPNACLERDFTSDPQSFHNLAGLAPITDNYAAQHGTMALMNKIFSFRLEFDQSDTLSCLTSGKGCFPVLGKSRPDVFSDQNMISLLGRTDDASFFPELDKALCDSNRVPIGSTCLKNKATVIIEALTPAPAGGPSNSLNHAHVLFPTIDQQLNNNNPVLGMIHASFLVPPDPKMNNSNDGHSIIITGRKYRTAKPGEVVTDGCFYQIRNSWGSNVCSSYGKNVVDCDNQGYAWISEEMLDQNTTGIMFMNP